MVGGNEWIENGDGTFVLNCGEGRSGAHHASPIDKYMMGLIPGDQVPTLHLNEDIRIPNCGETITSQHDVTIEEIQNLHGVREPGPENAQRDFNIVFVAESHNRLLNPTELTFYEILAAHYTKEVPAGEPAPYIKVGWPSITRFFGEGTTWSSTIPRFNDADADGDVELNDYQSLAGCLSGPASTVGKSCRIFDRDNNLSVDLKDFARFQNAFTGP